MIEVQRCAARLWMVYGLVVPVATMLIPTDDAGARRLVLDPVNGPYRSFAECWREASQGDTIEVAPGVYTEALEPPTLSLLIRSRDGAESTILDGEGSRRIASVSRLRTTFEGLTFRNGRGAFGGGAIRSQGTVELRSCVFRNNRSFGLRAPRGGAVYVLRNCTVRDCLFANNRVEPTMFDHGGQAGAVYADYSLEIHGSTFLGNAADTASAAACRYDLAIRNSLFVDDGGARESFFRAGDDVDLRCNLVWPGRSPAEGPRVFRAADGALLADPRICPTDPEALHETSPALTSSECGRIGTLPVGCAGREIFSLQPQHLERTRSAVVRAYGYGLDDVNGATLFGPGGVSVTATRTTVENAWVSTVFDLSGAWPGRWSFQLESPEGPLVWPDSLTVPSVEVYGFLDGWIEQTPESGWQEVRLWGKGLGSALELRLRSRADSSVIPVTLAEPQGPDTLAIRLDLSNARAGLYDLFIQPSLGEEVSVPSVLFLGKPFILRVPEDAPSIGEAIARALPGTEIQVGRGLWRESLTIDRPLRIVGVSMYHRSRIQPPFGSRPVHIRREAGPLATLRALEIRGGVAQDGPGGGILCESPALITWCSVLDCIARGAGARGGGIYGVPGTRLEHCDVRQNEAASTEIPEDPWSTDPLLGGIGGNLHCRDCSILGGFFGEGSAPAIVASGRITHSGVDIGHRAILQGQIEDNSLEVHSWSDPARTCLIVDGPSTVRRNSICVWDGGASDAGYVSVRGPVDFSQNALNFVRVDVCPWIDPVAESAPGQLRIVANRLNEAEVHVHRVDGPLPPCIPSGEIPERLPIPEDRWELHCNSSDFYFGENLPCDTCVAPAGESCDELTPVPLLECVFGPVLLLDHGVEARGPAARLWWRVNADMTLLGYEIVRSLDGADTLLTPAPLPGCYECEFTDPAPPPSGRVVYKLGILTSDAGREWYELGEWSPSAGRRGITLLAPSPHPLAGGGMVRLRLGRAESRVRLELFDLSGRLVVRLWDGPMAAGERSMAWDGHYDTGRPLASGVYQLRATAGLQSASRKILLLH